jgi:hypothetical protein
MEFEAPEKVLPRDIDYKPLPYQVVKTRRGSFLVLGGME